MAATRRTARASTSAQRELRVVERATPPRPKRSRSSGPRSSVHPPPALRRLLPVRRVAVELSPVPADLTQWRRGISNRLPRLDTVPRNYAYLRAFLQAAELAVQALDRPPDAFHITMQQPHPHLQEHIRTCMTARPDPTRTPYEHMVAIPIQQVAPGKSEDYLHQTIALIARRTDSQMSRLHMQFTEAYHAYRDLCARLRSPPHLGEHFVVTAFLGNLPKDIARDTRNQAGAADRLNDLQYVARLAMNFDTLARTYPGRGEHRPHDNNTLTLNDDFYAPPPPPIRHPPHPQLRRARKPRRRRATTPPPADARAFRRAVFCAASPAPGSPPAPPAICNHTRLDMCPRTPNKPTHTRAWATIDGVRCEVIIHTGADMSLIPADVLRPHRSHQPWAPAHGCGTGANNHTLQVVGRVALEVRLGPLKTTGPFSFVPGVAFASLSSVDFLEVVVSLARHALTFAGQRRPDLSSPRPPPAPRPFLCPYQNVALNPGNTAWVPTTLPPPQTAPASPLLPFEAVRNVRLVAADPAPPLAEGPGETPSYEEVPGGFLPTLPSPNNCLLPAELQQLRDLLHEFRDCFNDGSEPLFATSVLKARLDTGDAQPISTPACRLSPAMRQVVRDAVAGLDAQGITEPSTGCWTTPIVMVRKASGAWRLCCDYRASNKHVRIPQQPLPRTDDILASLNDKKYFTVVDMCKGFYQIEIVEEDRPTSGFVTPDCQRQYRRPPFGFASNPAIFQRMVDLLLGGMK
ncbi:hypothetical protein Emag_007502 [Eimeria magna]